MDGDEEFALTPLTLTRCNFGNIHRIKLVKLSKISLGCVFDNSNIFTDAPEFDLAEICRKNSTPDQCGPAEIICTA